MDHKVDIARALKDRSYYESLSEKERSLVPNNAAGTSELSDEDLAAVAGGVADQTGSGSGCTCLITKTAVSGSGHCDCHCDAVA